MFTSPNYSGCSIGAFVNGMENLADFEKCIGRKLAVILLYTHWPTPFPEAEAEAAYQNGSVPMFTWEPRITEPQGNLISIAEGKYDSYIRSFIQAAKQWGKPLLLRFSHEMNGDWYPWDGTHNGKSSGAENYKKAWSYIYSIRRDLAADNIQLVWCPNNNSQPDEEWNDLANYYPGDQLVDWVGMDGYNWGYSQWQTFDAIFEQSYTKLSRLTDKPLMLGEFGTSGENEQKARWIEDALDKIENKYQKIKLFCWFNINKERDWRINSCAAAEEAMRNGLQKKYFLDKIEFRRAAVPIEVA